MAKRSDEEQPVDETPATPNSPDPWAVMDKLANALAAINQKLDSQPAQGPEQPATQELMRVLATAMDRIADVTKSGHELQAIETKRAHRPSNEVVPQISVFNRRGTRLPADATGPRKPPLKCVMMLPWLVEWESITREEAELLNLLQPGEYILKRIDNSKVRVTIQVDLRVDGKTPSRLLMNHDTAFNNDNFRLVPPMPDFLRQLLRQHEPEVRQAAAAVLTDEEEEALIEAGELSVSV